MKLATEGIEKAKEFAVSNPIAFSLSLMWVITIILVFLRDRSWSATVQDLERALSAVEFDKNRLLEQTQGPDGANISELCKVAFELMQKSSSEALNALIKEIPKYFSVSSFLQIVFLLSCTLFEFNLLYSGVSTKLGGKDVNRILVVQTLNFLSKYHPITSILFGIFIITKSALAWIGFIDRNSFVQDMLQWQLSYYLAGILSYIINNLVGAIKYLPKDSATWKESMKQSSWWIWLATRAFGVHNPNLAGVNLLWLLLKTIFAYAFRYFFYYRKQVLAFEDSNHVFFINNLVHIWIVFLSALIFYLPSIVLNLNRLQVETNQTWLVITVRRSVVTSMNYINRLLCDHQTLGLYTFFLMAVLAVYVLRFFYFLWTAKATWYAWFVSWIFLHMHIALVLLALPGLNFMMQRLKMNKVVRGPFVEKFGEGLLHVNNDKKAAQDVSTPEATSTAGDARMSTEDACRLGETYYEETLLGAMLYSVFTDLTPLKQEREEQKKRDASEGKPIAGDDSIEDEELYQVFNLVLQSDLLAMEEEDQAADEEGEQNDGQQQENTDTLNRNSSESASATEDKNSNSTDSTETLRQRNNQNATADSSTADSTTTYDPTDSYLDHDKLD